MTIFTRNGRLRPTIGSALLLSLFTSFAGRSRDRPRKVARHQRQRGGIGSKRPRLFTVQAEGCAPIVRAFHAGEKFAAEFPDAQTKASGLRMPRAIGDFIMLDALRNSHGGAMAVSDEATITATREVGSAEGIFAAPEGAACYAALKILLKEGTIKPHKSTGIFNTG